MESVRGSGVFGGFSDPSCCVCVALVAQSSWPVCDCWCGGWGKVAGVLGESGGDLCPLFALQGIQAEVTPTPLYVLGVRQGGRRRSWKLSV